MRCAPVVNYRKGVIDVFGLAFRELCSSAIYFFWTIRRGRPVGSRACTSAQGFRVEKDLGNLTAPELAGRQLLTHPFRDSVRLAPLRVEYPVLRAVALAQPIRPGRGALEYPRRPGP